MRAHRRRQGLFDEELRLWDQMPPVGREFGSPDFERLMAEDQRDEVLSNARVSRPGQTCSATSSSSTTLRSGTPCSVTSARGSLKELWELRSGSIEPTAAQSDNRKV